MNMNNLSLKYGIKYFYYAIKDLLINKNKYNQVNNNSDIEYIKNVMDSIVSHYE